MRAFISQEQIQNFKKSPIFILISNILKGISFILTFIMLIPVYMIQRRRTRNNINNKTDQ